MLEDLREHGTVLGVQSVHLNERDTSHNFLEEQGFSPRRGLPWSSSPTDGVNHIDTSFNA